MILEECFHSHSLSFLPAKTKELDDIISFPALMHLDLKRAPASEGLWDASRALPGSWEACWAPRMADAGVRFGFENGRKLRLRPDFKLLLLWCPFEVTH